MTFILTSELNAYFGTTAVCWPLSGWETRRVFFLMPLVRTTKNCVRHSLMNVQRGGPATLMFVGTISMTVENEL